VKITSIEYAGFGNACGVKTVTIPDGHVITYKGRTGTMKSLTFEAAAHAFGMDIPSHRVTVSTDGVLSSRYVRVAMIDGSADPIALTRVDDKDSSTWVLSRGKETAEVTNHDDLQTILGKLVAQPSAIKSWFMTEQTSAFDMISFDRFMKSVASDYMTLFDRKSMVSGIMANYEANFEDLQNACDRGEDITSLASRKLALSVDLKNVADERQAIETRRDKLKEKLTDLASDEKNVATIESNIRIAELKIKSFKELVEIKSNNIRECEEKLATIKSQGITEEAVACARKTEVNLDKQLRDVEASIKNASERAGSIGAAIAGRKSEISTILAQRDKVLSGIEADRVLVAAAGINVDDPDLDTGIKKRADEIEKIISAKTAEDEMSGMELAVLKKVGEFTKKVPAMNHCPCCGQSISTTTISSFFGRRKSIIDTRLKKRTDQLKAARSDLRHLRSIGDAARSLSTKSEQSAAISKRADELSSEVSALAGEHDKIADELKKHENGRDEILAAVKAEQKMIDAIELRSRIESAKKDLEIVSENIASMEEEIVDLSARKAVMATIEAIETNEKDVSKEIEIAGSDIIVRVTRCSEMKRQICVIDDAMDSRKQLEKELVVARKKFLICTSLFDCLEKIVAKERERIDAQSMQLGKATAGVVIDKINASKNEMNRNIDGKSVTQNFIALSSGERVLIAAEAKAINNVWKCGGFAIVDAGLSDDVIQKCGKILSDNGCEQSIFLVTGDDDAFTVVQP
jgi:hypothetical protein